MSPAPRARFDDLRTERALVFAEADEVLVAHRPEEVPAVLAAVEHATAAGRWAFGHVAYEAAPGLDPTLRTREPEPDGPPVAWFGLAAAPTREPALAGTDPHGAFVRGPWTPRLDEPAHKAAVEAVRAAIADGETYQVNLTTRLDGEASGDLLALYADLALGQRGAHHAYLDLGRHVVIGASPELFFARDGDALTLRPMKGTAPRGRTRAEDDAVGAALARSAKDRAENVMIVDLLRNDAARVATTGSVRVDSLCALERYETVLQLTSQVSARLRPGVGLVELFTALFPCGSVTGAPKARTMGLVAELEDAPRGVYCGAVGWVAPGGRAEFSVAIRTLVADRETGRGVYGSGGGITWDSEPAAEHAELLTKAALLDRRHEEFALLETFAHDGPVSPDRPVSSDGTVPSAGRAGPRHLDDHLARLADSAARLGFVCDRDAVRAAVLDAVDGHPPARVRLRLERDGTPRVELGPLPAPDPGPVRLAVDDEPVDPDEVWPHHKTTRRAPYDRRRARHPEADDVVLVNTAGELTETTVANLAVRLDGRWWTPPPGGGALPGVGRGRLVAVGVLGERVLRREDLVRARAVAVVSSLRGWRAATVVGGLVTGRGPTP